MKHKYAQTRVPVNDLIARRWSSRGFDLQQPVARDDLLSLLEAARWAPTCFDEEPWRFVVFDRGQDEAGWNAAQECLLQWNRPWAERAPLLILVACAKKFTANGEINRWSAYDTGAAVENLVLQATSLGLMSRQIGGFDESMTRSRFAVPDEYEVMAFIALGHPVENIDHLYEKHREAELAERSRAPFEANVFAGSWNGVFDEEKG
jgi:nitroreductase